MMALYQKTYVTRSTICVESFMIVSQSARNAHFWCYAALLTVVVLYIYNIGFLHYTEIYNYMSLGNDNDC